MWETGHLDHLEVWLQILWPREAYSLKRHTSPWPASSPSLFSPYLLHLPLSSSKLYSPPLWRQCHWERTILFRNNRPGSKRFLSALILKPCCLSIAFIFLNIFEDPKEFLWVISTAIYHNQKLRLRSSLKMNVLTNFKMKIIKSIIYVTVLNSNYIFLKLRKCHHFTFFFFFFTNLFNIRLTKR